MILWTVGFFVVAIGAGFVGPKFGMLAILAVYLALPVIGHHLLIRSSGDEA
jgi:hypothetical protein